MSVGLLIIFKGHRDELIPVATEDIFLHFWQPGIDVLGLKYFVNGISHQPQDILSILADLLHLRDWFQKIKSHEVRFYCINRLDNLVSTLEKLNTDKELVEIFIG